MKNVICIFLMIFCALGNSQELTGDLKRDIDNLGVFSSQRDYRSTGDKLIGLTLGLSYTTTAHFLDWDKTKHSLGGLWLSGVGYMVTYGLTDGDRKKARLYGFGASAVAGLGKEFYDMRSGGTGFNFGDLFITWIAGIVGTISADLLASKN